MSTFQSKIVNISAKTAATCLLVGLSGCVVAPQQAGAVRSVDAVQPFYTQPYYNQPYYSPYYSPFSYPDGYSAPFATPFSQPAYPLYRNSAPAARVAPVGPAAVAPVRKVTPRVRAAPVVRPPAVRAPRPAATVAPVNAAPRAPAQVRVE